MKKFPHHLLKALVNIFRTLAKVPGLSFLGEALLKVVEKEISQPAGIVNLALCLILAIITGGVFVIDAATKIISKLLEVQEIPAYYFLGSMILLVLFFTWCVNKISDTQPVTN